MSKNNIATNEDHKSSEQTSIEKSGFMLSILFLVIGVFFYYYFAADASKTLISFGSLALGVILFGVFFFLSTKGKKLMVFFKEARRELHRVTWPTKDETKKMTIMVLVVMGIILIYLLLADWILRNLVFWLVELVGGIL